MSGALSVTGDPVGLPGLLALGVGFFAFLAVLVAAQRRRAAAEGETTARRSPASIVGVAIQGLAIGFTSIGIQRATLDPLSAKALSEAGAVALLMAATVGLFVWASRTMGQNWSIVARTRGDHALVTAGPFAWIRHPIYTALFLMMIALAIGLGHVARLFIAVPLYALGTAFRVRIEERLLRTAFSSAYEEYANRVKRFIPGVL
ncbi:MAG TPA: isoprenylcysteine carboxylmethyltransferase family protein [Chthoniobacterales bacterium]|jgi:protein-S-isoprenylcysteine O-methyltransferase Ste14